MKNPIGLQPFTIREEMKKDMLGTLEKVAEIGYKGVELGPPDNMSTAELKSHLERMGLQVISAHTSTEKLANNLDQLIDFCGEVGSGYVVLSWSKCESKSAILEAAPLYNKAGEKLKKHGIQFCYHNHDHEFKKFEGEYALDILLNATDPEFVQMEMDTYWVKKGGENPAQYLRKLKGRCPLLHFKDMEDNESKFFAEVGAGNIDFIEIASIAREAGTKWFIVEQDECRRSPLESIKISFDNLKKMDLV